MKKEAKPKAAKKPTKKATKQKKASPKQNTAQCGRNADGTFAKGNTIGVGYGGRPKSYLSFKDMAKIRASEDPSLVTDTLDTLATIAKDPNHPKCVEAADKLIKLMGNYDPSETNSKTELSGSIQTEAKDSPFKDLTKDDLLKLLKRKK